MYAREQDKSGFLAAEEFGDFMRLGEAEKGPGWKERLAEQQAEKGRLARLEKESVGGRRVIDAEPASAEAMTELSKQFNAQLSDPLVFPGGADVGWFKLFLLVDEDGSGMITWDEFESALHSAAAARVRFVARCARLFVRR